MRILLTSLAAIIAITLLPSSVSAVTAGATPAALNRL